MALLPRRAADGFLPTFKPSETRTSYVHIVSLKERSREPGFFTHVGLSRGLEFRRRAFPEAPILRRAIGGLPSADPFGAVLKRSRGRELADPALADAGPVVCWGRERLWEGWRALGEPAERAEQRASLHFNEGPTLNSQ
ncbi:hypothetical protein R1flu_029077 [Riccia fluitans]|uniref:Uncharacterized protein n=1 Tax=Riccia fluitans TaxID=41844 RepID=A0ABD1XNK0_9MARC